MNPHPPADWLEFWVRFVCGAALGVGASLALYTDGSSSEVWPVIAVGGVVVGLLAGWFGDRFWHSLKGWY